MGGHPAAASAPERVCPHCGTLAATSARRCPFCGRGYARHTVAAVAVLLLVFAVGILAGVVLALGVFARELEDELDRQVRTVERRLDRNFDQVQRGVREELDRRLPAGSSAAP